MKKVLFLLLFPFLTLTLKAQTDRIGVYMKNGNVIEKIHPIKYSGSKTNALGSALTMGLAGTSMKVVFRGRESKNIATNKTVFYFYFPQILNPYMAMEYYMFSPGYSPRNFILAKLVQKKKTRELGFGNVNIYIGSNVGVSPYDDVEMVSTLIKDGVYSVSINGNLPSGEYCFLFDGSHGSGAFSSVFDFSIK